MTDTNSEGEIEGAQAADAQVRKKGEKTLAWWRLVRESDSVEWLH